jgi:PQQ-like domain
VAIANGLVFAPDLSGFLHCLDAKTGERYWAYDMEAAMWGTPMVVGNKVYLTDEDGDVAIFEASKEFKEPATMNMGSGSYASPVLANGVLYIMTKETLYAIEQKK